MYVNVEQKQTLKDCKEQFSSQALLSRGLSG